METGGDVLVIGIGDGYRGDDGVGGYVVRALRARSLTGVRVVEHTGEGCSLMDRWSGARLVFFADAVVSGAPPGAIHRFEPTAEPGPGFVGHMRSAHGFGLAEALALSRALGRLPERLVIYGVEGREFGTGAGLSPEVQRSADEVVRRIVSEIEEALLRRAPAHRVGGDVAS